MRSAATRIAAVKRARLGIATSPKDAFLQAQDMRTRSTSHVQSPPVDSISSNLLDHYGVEGVLVQFVDLAVVP